MPKKVLVVEDDKFLRDLYLDLLKSAGFTCDQAEDGDTALTKITSGGYDLVLLDVMLPKLDGLSILRKLKATPPATPNGAIVMLSNLGQDDAQKQALDLGAKGYMIKSDYTPDQALAKFQSFVS